MIKFECWSKNQNLEKFVSATCELGISPMLQNSFDQIGGDMSGYDFLHIV